MSPIKWVEPPNRFEDGFYTLSHMPPDGSPVEYKILRWSAEKQAWITNEGPRALLYPIWSMPIVPGETENMPNNAYDAYVQASKEDIINSPSHYTARVPEPINVIRDWGLNFCLGNAVKYIARAGLKGGPEKAIEDLEKARKYLEFEIERLGNLNGVR